MSNSHCPCCSSAQYTRFHSLANIPVHVGALWEDPDSAKTCPRGVIDLAYCRQCGFIGNVGFEPQLINYERPYDNALHFSSVFQNYEQNLAQRLIRRYRLQEPRIVEIGSGDGHFLRLICDLSHGTGIGYDPSYQGPAGDFEPGSRVQLKRAYFTTESAEQSIDLLCCRHVLEHVPDPRQFLTEIYHRLAHQPDTVIYVEVPNVRLILERLSIWDIMYEHCDYFSVESLHGLFERCGFEVLQIAEVYDKQFIGIEARCAAQNAPKANGGVRSIGLETLNRQVAEFATRFLNKQAYWTSALKRMTTPDRSVVIWGAGGKTVSFVNMFDIGESISAVVDINPAKQNTYLAGTGHRIINPVELINTDPKAVIVMNPVYKDEIDRELQRLGIECELLMA